jgi:ABC-type transporter Mla MlaB component
VDYLSSAGVALLLDAIHSAAEHNTLLQLQLAPHSLTARMLAVIGLEPIVPTVTETTHPTVSSSSSVNPD